MFPVSLNSVSNSRGLTNLGKHMFRFEENKSSSTNSTNTTLLNHQRLICTVGELLRTIVKDNSYLGILGSARNQSLYGSPGAAETLKTPKWLLFQFVVKWKIYDCIDEPIDIWHGTWKKTRSIRPNILPSITVGHIFTFTDPLWPTIHYHGRTTHSDKRQLKLRKMENNLIKRNKYNRSN